MKAQGNALGNWQVINDKALQGRNKIFRHEFVSPLQGFFRLCHSANQGVALA
jgi:hypothetical protein